MAKYNATQQSAIGRKVVQLLGVSGHITAVSAIRVRAGRLAYGTKVEVNGSLKNIPEELFHAIADRPMPSLAEENHSKRSKRVFMNIWRSEMVEAESKLVWVIVIATAILSIGFSLLYAQNPLKSVVGMVSATTGAKGSASAYGMPTQEQMNQINSFRR